MQNEQIKILFVDIDWTILDHANNHTYDKESLLALCEAQKRGVKVFYCTARPLYSLSQIGAFDILKPDGVVSANGGVVTIDGKTIYKEYMPLDVFEKACEVATKYDYNMLCAEVEDCFLLKEKDKYFEQYITVYYEPIPRVDDYKGKEVISIILFAPEEMDETFKKELPNGLNYYRYHEAAVELVDRYHQKGTGVKEVLKYYGLNKENAMSFGDDYGDIDMFNECAIGVAMGNGKDEVKNAATYVTKEVWNSGVKEALIKYRVI